MGAVSAVSRERVQSYGSVTAVTLLAGAVTAYCYDLESSVAGAALIGTALILGALSVACSRYGSPKALLVSSALGAALLAPVGLFLLFRSSDVNLISTILIGDWAANREPLALALLASAAFYVALAALTQKPALLAGALAVAPVGVMLLSAGFMSDPISTRSALILISAALAAAVAQRALPSSWEAHTLGICAALLVASRFFMSLTDSGEILIAAIIVVTVSFIHARSPSVLSSVSVVGAALILTDQLVDLSQSWLFVWIVASLALLWRSLTLAPQRQPLGAGGDPAADELAETVELRLPPRSVGGSLPIPAVVSEPRR